VQREKVTAGHRPNKALSKVLPTRHVHVHGNHLYGQWNSRTLCLAKVPTDLLAAESRDDVNLAMA